ncbi:MAG: HAMP domain-containing sensor histidine kinase, partial [Saprospiraceae bacterium]
TLEEYGEGAICSNEVCATACGIPEEVHRIDNSKPSAELINNELFQSDLRKTLDFYNIGLHYQITQSSGDPAANTKGSATCVVNLPAHADEEASFIALDFPDKEKFMMGKLKFMIGASIIILLFTAFVLLLANWWLLKQKRLLRTNVEIYNNMAHEFRTPLTNINLAANLLTKNIDSEKSSKFLDIISRENSKLIRQVERVLHLARLDNGDYDLRNEKVNVKVMLDTVVEDLSMQIDERQGKIQIEVPDHLEIFGDRQHLSNVFRNLIDNALKYANDAPVISILAKENNDGMIISVRDNGVGIPSSQTEFIFEKFQRIQDGNLHAQKGFGLGLAYVKKIVELHKGSVKVDSEINKGSCFNIFLPKFC